MGRKEVQLVLPHPLNVLKNYYPTVSITQNQAVNYVKEIEIDEGGTNTEAMEAIIIMFQIYRGVT